MSTIIISLLEGDSMTSPIHVAAEVSGTFGGSILREYVPGDIHVAAEPSGNLSGYVGRTTSINLRVGLDLTLQGSVRNTFVLPEPVLPQIPAGWLDTQNYIVRLIDSLGSNIPFVSAQIRGDRNRLGEIATIVLARKDWADHSFSKTYTMQLGTRSTPTGPIEWATLIESGILQNIEFSSAYGPASPEDSVSLTLSSTWQNRLNSYPIRGRILFDPFQTSVDLQTSDRIYYENGTPVPTDVYSRPNQKLRAVLRGIITKLLLVGQLETNVPDYPVARVDFPITSSYYDVISGLLGLFDPLFYFDEGTLHIVNRNQTTPEDFNPTALIADEYVQWQHSSENQNVEGLLLTYTQKLSDVASSELESLTSHEYTGVFGQPGSSMTTTTTTWKHWKNDADTIIRSEIIREEKVTYNAVNQLIGRVVYDHAFDGNGNRKGSTHTIEARLPNVDMSGESLQLARIEEQRIDYSAVPKDPRSSYQSKITTEIRGLIVVDTENQYLGEDFKQEFLKAHEAGNFKAGMSLEFGPIESVTERVSPIRNNQFQVTGQRVDHLRNVSVPIDGEPRSGNPSLGVGGGSRSGQLLILKEGVTPTTRAGKAIPVFGVGELPLIFAKPLAKNVLKNLVSGKKRASVVVSGWHHAMKRGLTFKAVDRAGESYGVFITEGLVIDISAAGTSGQRITTTLEAAEI